jgi:hypothetical protein
MKKISFTIALAVMVAGCAHRPGMVAPAPVKRHHAVHKVAAVPVAHPVAAPVAPPVAEPAPPPVAQVAPPPVVPAPVAAPATPKHGALRWFLRDRSTSGR